MKRKLLLLICMIVAAVALLTACTITGNDAKIRSEGYNVRVVMDCGKYSSEEISLYDEGWDTVYGETSLSDDGKYFLGKVGEQNVLYFNAKNGDPVQEQAEQKGTQKTPLVTLNDRELVGWYIASVVAYKLDENGDPIKNAYGQYEYGAVVPQDTDVEFDFKNDRLSLYNVDGTLSKFIATKYVYDADSSFDATDVVVGKVAIEGSNRIDYVGGKTVETNGVDYATFDDPAAELGYSEENGYNVYIYAKWRGKTKFVVESQNEEGEWKIQAAIDTALNRGLNTGHKDLKKDGYTVVNFYTSKEFTPENLFDMNKKFSDCYVGDINNDYTPYVFLYAEYIKGDWEVVTDARGLKTALGANLNVYMKSDVAFNVFKRDEGGNVALDSLGNAIVEDTWTYVKEYSAVIEGNNHKITFEAPFVIDDDLIEKNNLNYGLFGKFNGTLKDVTFENVVVKINLKESGKGSALNPNKLIACGVFAGEIGADSVFSNVLIKGTLDKTVAVEAGWIVNSQGTWYNTCAISPVPEIFEDTGLTE